MRHIALEIPLRALAVVGRRQRRHAANTRVQALRDALDHAALAGRVTPFEQDDNLVAGVHHPVLQLHELALQPDQLTEIVLPLAGGVPRCVVQRQRVVAVLELQLELLIEIILKVTVNALHQFVVDRAHGLSCCKPRKLGG